MRWFRRKQPPLECYDRPGYVYFNRLLTADEMTLLRWAWDAASRGLPRPDTGWPPMTRPFPPAPKPPQPVDRTGLIDDPHHVQDVSGQVFTSED